MVRWSSIRIEYEETMSFGVERGVINFCLCHPCEQAFAASVQPLREGEWWPFKTWGGQFLLGRVPQ